VSLPDVIRYLFLFVLLITNCMFAEYIQAALERAEYEIIDNPDPYYAHVPGLVGVWATGKTFEECRKELIEVIEEWIVAKLQWGQSVPPLGGLTISTSAKEPIQVA
jgi:predicted RNase H-like HicB family nuclease